MDKIQLKATLPLRQVVPVLIVFIILTIVGLYHHVMGLEEAQQYVLARDSTSLADLYKNMRYEGHPRLWCGVLYLIIHYLTSSPVAIEVLHLLITSATVFLFLRYAPFDRWIKTGIVLGYYFLFEYNMQLRSYGLGILLLFICCMLLRDPERFLLWIGVLLLVMCNTDLFYAIAASGIYLCLLIEYARQQRLFTPAFLGLTFLFLAGIVCIFIQAQIPRQDFVSQGVTGSLLSRKNISAALLAVTAGWLPVPQRGPHFWNTFAVNHLGFFGMGILCLFLLLFPLMVLRGRRRALVFYYSSVFCLLGFLVISTFGAARYYGMVFIYFLAACWMDPFQPLDGRPLLRAVFGIVVVIQLVVGGYAMEQIITRPFSQAKNAAAYVKEHRLGDQPIVEHGYVAGPALCVYLGTKLWYLNTGGEGSYCIWSTAYIPRPPRTVYQELATSPALLQLNRFLLLSSSRLDSLESDGFRFEQQASFSNTVLSSEDCYIYQAIKK